MGIEELARTFFEGNRTTVDNLAEALVFVRPNGKIVGWNSPFESLVQKNGTDTYAGKRIFADYPFESPNQKQSLLDKCIAERIPLRSSRVHFTGKEYDERYVNMNLSPLIEGQTVVGAQISFVDVTQEVLEAIRDGLTGAYSQSYYVRDLQSRAIHEAMRSRITGSGGQLKQGYLGVIGIDLKKLKYVNDHLGHDTGDRMLKDTARILAESVRATDYVVRVGGDEFYILCPGADEGGIKIVERKISENLAEHNSKLHQIPSEQPNGSKKQKISLHMISAAATGVKEEDYSPLFEYIGDNLKKQKRPT
ncbi:MAG: diguanylate cyclase [Nanoarchaeota archaeon]|nr:diguanylate cyclase [Nanoarchaeota archaeon]MBU1004792.1 diguanylate cyclase [Nanoarchaeota archaeon]MBU1946490.1 diguanylate cyclase [Nanoarchaeota archaeon]